MGRIRDLFRRAEKRPNDKYFRAAAAEVWPYEVQHGRPRPDDLAQGLETSAAHVWVYACTNAVARCAARVPIEILKPAAPRGQQVTALPSDPVARPFLAVNDFMSQAELIELTVLHLLLTGNAYWDIERQTGEIWPLRPDRVSVVPHSTEFVSGYLYRNRGVTVRFDVDEVVHFKLPNPSDPWYGLAPLRAAFDSVQADRYAILGSKQFQQHGAVPAGILTAPHALDSEQVERLRGEWKRLYGGPKGRQRVAVLQGGMDFRTISISARDAEVIAQRKLNREEICAVFGVPPAVVGLFEYANYANADVQERLFWRNTVIPHVRRIAQRLNESDVLPQGWHAEPDLSDLATLLSDQPTQGRSN
ncbi:MAG: phage portal protein [Candidatus Alcyoniella australis]|nr:phage portal protein [Candidatus Alcyoniella australis]